VANATVISDGFEASIGKDVLFGGFTAAKELTESDRAKAERVWNLYQKAKKWKMQCGGDKWQKWWDFWRGRQWEKRRAQGFSMKVINETYSATETFVGNVGEEIPESNVLARKLEEKPTAEMFAKLINWTHDINEQDTELELPVRSAVVTGTGIRRVEWDWTMDGKRGAPRMIFVDEQYIFFSPYTKKAQTASYIIEAQNVPKEEVVRRWPERGPQVPGGMWDGTLTPLYGGGGSLSTAASGDTASFTIPDGTQTQQSSSILKKADKDLVTLMEVWIRQEDDTLRYIVCANGMILQDGPSPYQDEKYPYVVYNVIRNKDSIYGYSLVEQLESMQTELNEIHSYALDQQKYESDSPLVVNIANVQEGKHFNNAPGNIYYDKAASGQGYYTLQKQGANPKWFDMEERLRAKMRDISGGVDILHGEMPAQVTTLGGAEIIKQQANVIVSKMTKHVKAAVRNEDMMILDRMVQFFKDERIVRVSGHGGKQEHVTVNERTSLDDNGEWGRKNSIPDDFEADVDFSAVPPGGYQAKFERAMALLQGGVVDGQYVLEQIDEDQGTVEALMQRMAAAQKAQMQAEMAAKGQAPPPEEEQDPSQMADQLMGMLSGQAA
jgi:hypothetical protein